MALESKNTKLGQTALSGMQVTAYFLNIFNLKCFLRPDTRPLLRPEAAVRGQVCGRSFSGGRGPGEAAAQPDVGSDSSHTIAPRGPTGGGHEGEGRVKLPLYTSCRVFPGGSLHCLPSTVFHPD